MLSLMPGISVRMVERARPSTWDASPYRGCECGRRANLKTALIDRAARCRALRRPRASPSSSVVRWRQHSASMPHHWLRAPLRHLQRANLVCASLTSRGFVNDAKFRFISLRRKAHRATPRQEVLRGLPTASRRALRGKLLFLEDYDITSPPSRAGATSCSHAGRSLEASVTSGQKFY